MVEDRSRRPQSALKPMRRRLRPTQAGRLEQLAMPRAAQRALKHQQPDRRQLHTEHQADARAKKLSSVRRSSSSVARANTPSGKVKPHQPRLKAMLSRDVMTGEPVAMTSHRGPRPTVPAADQADAVRQLGRGGQRRAGEPPALPGPWSAAQAAGGQRSQRQQPAGGGEIGVRQLCRARRSSTRRSARKPGPATCPRG